MDNVCDYGQVAEALLDYVETNTTDQAATTMAVPASSYTDPARWALEMDRIFQRLPLLLGLSVELPEPGSYKAMEVLDKPVLIWRGNDGVVRAMLNVCTHRGAPVAKAGSGKCSRMSCPYHGWTYGSDGRLVGVADRSKFGDIDPAAHGLKQLPCTERAGLIFVSLTPGLNQDIETFLGGMLTELEAFDLDRWYYVGQREIFGANWKIAYDGYLEGYHFAVAHPATIHPRTYSDVMKYDAYGPHIRTGYAQTRIGELRSKPREAWAGLENQGFDFVRTLFPNVSIFLAPEIAQIAVLLPGPTVRENRTLLFYIAAQAPEDEAERETLVGMMNFLRDVTNHEDYELGLGIQKGLESGALQNVVFGRNERGNQYFHKWVDFYVDATTTTAPVL